LRDLPALARFFDDVATGDQILDDLEDVDDDLRRGRFNYVAQRLCRGRVGTFDIEKVRREIARALALDDGADRVLDDARRRFVRASATAARMRIPALVALAATAARSVDDLALGFHRAQVRRVMAG
jgi:ribosomal protein L29